MRWSFRKAKDDILKSLPLGFVVCDSKRQIKGKRKTWFNPTSFISKIIWRKSVPFSRVLDTIMFEEWDDCFILNNREFLQKMLTLYFMQWWLWSDRNCEIYYLAPYKTLTADDMQSPQWRFAPYLVATNNERLQLNYEQALRFAKEHNTFLYRWPILLKKWKNKEVSLALLGCSIMVHMVQDCPFLCGENPKIDHTYYYVRRSIVGMPSSSTTGFPTRVGIRDEWHSRPLFKGTPLKLSLEYNSTQKKPAIPRS